MRRVLVGAGVLALVAALGVPAISHAEPAADPSRGPVVAWQDGDPVPLGRIRYGHTQCDSDPGRFYVLGGLDRTFNPTITAMAYDAAAGKWDALPNIPEALQGATAVCTDRKIHLLGGLDRHGQDTIGHYVYDLDGGKQWQSMASLPRPVWLAAAGAVDGRIYLIGGGDDALPKPRVSDEVNVYDIATDTWMRNAARMPAGALAAGSVQAGHHVYLVGGWDDAAPASNVVATQRLDLRNATWSTGPDLTSGRADLALAATDSALYAIGGDADRGGFQDATANVERLDLARWPSGRWTTEPDRLPVPLAANSGGFCTESERGQHIWSVGGANPVDGITDHAFFAENREGCPRPLVAARG